MQVRCCMAACYFSIFLRSAQSMHAELIHYQQIAKPKKQSNEMYLQIDFNAKMASLLYI